MVHREMPTDQEGGELPAEAFIETAQQVEALSSNLRLRILKLAAEPTSVRAIADTMTVPSARL